MGCALKTTEGRVKNNAGKWQSNRFFKNDAFFGGSEYPSKTHTQKKIEMKHPEKIYFAAKCGGAAKSWLMHKTPQLCTVWINVYLRPLDF